MEAVPRCDGADSRGTSDLLSTAITYGEICLSRSRGDVFVMSDGLYFMVVV